MSGFSESPTARRAAIFSAACYQVILFFIARKADFSLASINRTFHGSTTRAGSLVCPRGASCDNPVARDDPLWS
jgi:hypothetical protein